MIPNRSLFERKRSVPSGGERLSPYLVAAARAVALPAPRVPGRADCALRSVVQSVTPRDGRTPPRSLRPGSCRLRSRLWRLWLGRAKRVAPLAVHAADSQTRSANSSRARSSVWALAITGESAPRSSDTPAWPRANAGTLSTTRKQRCATYRHACERFSRVSDERPAPRPRCAAGTGGSRADRRTTRPACRSARRQCPSVHPAAQWCALPRRPTHGCR